MVNPILKDKDKLETLSEGSQELWARDYSCKDFKSFSNFATSSLVAIAVSPWTWLQEKQGRVLAIDWFHTAAVYRARSSKESMRAVCSLRQCKEQNPGSCSQESQCRTMDGQDSHATMKWRQMGQALALYYLMFTPTLGETFLCHRWERWGSRVWSTSHSYEAEN